MTAELTLLEREVVKLLLEGDDPVLDVLRKQTRFLSAAKREYTGHGFFTHFRVPENAPRLADTVSFKVGDVEASMDGLQYGAGFLLYVERGMVSLLEGYSYEEPWPAKVKRFTVGYVGGQRNLDEISKTWKQAGGVRS